MSATDNSVSEEFYEVEKIVGFRKKGKSAQFFVRWKGYGPESDSWEPLKNLAGCPELVNEFVRLNPEYKHQIQGHGTPPKPQPTKRKRRQDAAAEQAKNGSSVSTGQDSKRRRVTNSVQTLSPSTSSIQREVKASPPLPSGQKTGDSSRSVKHKSCSSSSGEPSKQQVTASFPLAPLAKRGMASTTGVIPPKTGQGSRSSTSVDGSSPHNVPGHSAKVASAVGDGVKHSNDHGNANSHGNGNGNGSTSGAYAHEDVTAPSKSKSMMALDMPSSPTRLTLGGDGNGAGLVSPAANAREPPPPPPPIRKATVLTTGMEKERAIPGRATGKVPSRSSSPRIAATGHAFAPLPAQPAAAPRTPGVDGSSDVRLDSPPLWKLPVATVSAGEQTRALLTVDAVQQQGSLRQPHATQPDPVTDRWVKSLVGVELLGQEDTISRIKASEPGEIDPAAPSKLNGNQPAKQKKASKGDASSEELDLPFGSAIPTKMEEPVDVDFEDDHDSVVSPQFERQTGSTTEFTPDTISQAAKEGNINLFRRAVQRRVDFNEADGRGDSPLIVAVRHGQEDVVAFLLECTVNVNKPSNSGETPLMIAAQMNRHTICTRLVRSGAHLNTLLPPTNETALMMACQRDHVKTVEVLLRSGCDMAVRDMRGMTALEHVASVPCTSLDSRLMKHITRMTEYLLSAVSQRVQPDYVPVNPAVVGFRSFGSSLRSVYSISFQYQKPAAATSVCLFLLRGRLKQDSGGMRLSWAGPGTVAEVLLNGSEVTMHVKHNMYHLSPCQGSNELTVRLIKPDFTQEQQAAALDRVFACIYRLQQSGNKTHTVPHPT